jgi:hypothetical protein
MTGHENPSPSIPIVSANDGSYLHVGNHGSTWVGTPQSERVTRDRGLFRDHHPSAANGSAPRACPRTGRKSGQTGAGSTH